jgi:hypothetical protein
VSEATAHGLYKHPDGSECIWLEETQEWFVPLDAGGEGYGCEKEHPQDALILRLAEALWFYADPETYHACDFGWESPAGAFSEDFSDDHGDPFYARPMPGRTARAALRGEPPRKGPPALRVEHAPIWTDPEDGTKIVWNGPGYVPKSCVTMKRYVTDWEPRDE